MGSQLRKRHAQRQQKVLGMITRAMRAYHLVLRIKGKTRTTTHEEFYGFQARDVVEIYTRKKGFGSGVWYRLKDGRVIDAFGKRSSSRGRYVVRPLSRAS